MDDQQQIENVINTYIDSMNDSNADMVRDAFHQNAKLLDIYTGNSNNCQRKSLLGLSHLNNLTQ